MNPVSVASSIIHIVSIASQVASSIPLFYGQIKNATPETNNLSRNLRKLESILEEINKATRYGGNAASLMSFRHFEIKLAELQAGTIKELDGCIQRTILRLSHLVPAIIRNPSLATISIAVMTFVFATTSMYELHKRDQYRYQAIITGICALLIAVVLSTGDLDMWSISAYVPICIAISQSMSALGHTAIRHIRHPQSGEVEARGETICANSKENGFSKEYDAKKFRAAQ